jgi:hypothetical protein
MGKCKRPTKVVGWRVLQDERSMAQPVLSWMSWLSVGLYNFCRPHSGVTITQADQVTHRSPAMAAVVTEHLWSTCA